MLNDSWAKCWTTIEINIKPWTVCNITSLTLNSEHFLFEMWLMTTSCAVVQHFQEHWQPGYSSGRNQHLLSKKWKTNVFNDQGCLFHLLRPQWYFFKQPRVKELLEYDKRHHVYKETLDQGKVHWRCLISWPMLHCSVTISDQHKFLTSCNLLSM